MLPNPQPNPSQTRPAHPTCPSPTTRSTATPRQPTSRLKNARRERQSLASHTSSLQRRRQRRQNPSLRLRPMAGKRNSLLRPSARPCRLKIHKFSPSGEQSLALLQPTPPTLNRPLQRQRHLPRLCQPLLIRECRCAPSFPPPLTPHPRPIAWSPNAPESTTKRGKRGKRGSRFSPRGSRPAG